MNAPTEREVMEKLLAREQEFLPKLPQKGKELYSRREELIRKQDAAERFGNDKKWWKIQKEIFAINKRLGELERKVREHEAKLSRRKKRSKAGSAFVRISEE